MRKGYLREETGHAVGGLRVHVQVYAIPYFVHNLGHQNGRFAHWPLEDRRVEVTISSHHYLNVSDLRVGPNQTYCRFRFVRRLAPTTRSAPLFGTDFASTY